jgi:hypothetical protein
MSKHLAVNAFIRAPEFPSLLRGTLPALERLRQFIGGFGSPKRRSFRALEAPTRRYTREEPATVLVPFFRGEMAERFKAHAWKACVL